MKLFNNLFTGNCSVSDNGWFTIGSPLVHLFADYGESRVNQPWLNGSPIANENTSNSF
jgi:hypothetical protein